MDRLLSQPLQPLLFLEYGSAPMILNRLFSSVRYVAVAGVVLFLVFIYVTVANAQASKLGGILEGIVSDSSGAVVPNATLTIGNVLTNQSRSVTTDEQGFFRASQLAVGTYEVRLDQVARSYQGRQRDAY